MLVSPERIAARAKEVIAGRATAPWRWRGRTDGVQAPVSEAAAPSKAAAAPTVAPVEKLDGEPIFMPFGDLTIDSGKLVSWTVADGAAVKRGATVAEIETDKAVVEIEAPVDGVVKQMVTAPGTMVKMGGVIGVVRPA